MSQFNNAVADVAEVMKFENWLRFYFVKEAVEEAVRIEIQEEQLEAIRKEHENMFALADRYNGALIDYNKSCAETCAHIAALYDGPKYPTGTIGHVWDSKDLKLEMYLFGLWMQGHEAVLDEEFMTFNEWLEGFNSWKTTDEVQDYLARLTDVDSGADKGCGCVQ
ncbi:MAG: hypothetical protein KKE73_15295 [Proteobacteria bacterium]|nr:hypothetical protein [Pseudomonadota bacterium]